MFPLKVTLDELYNGTSKKLRLTKNVICGTCDGKGGMGDPAPCKGCKGQGVKVVIRQLGPGMIQQMQTMCNDCGGEGQTIPAKDRCKECKGAKVTKQKKTLEVFVNKGMKHGQRITFNGEGDQAPNTIPGDVVVVLQQQEHPVFKRENDNLFMRKNISLLQALTGFSFPIIHMDDRVLMVKSRPGEIITPGEIKAIRDQGMPQHKNPYVMGSLYIEFNVEFPKPEELTPNVVKVLQKVLPDTKSTDSSVPDSMDTEKESEEHHLEKVDIEAERRRYKEQQASREQYDEDDEPRGTQCRQA